MAPIDQTHLARLLAPGDELGAGPDVKGKALEDALRYAFEQIPGVACEMQRALNVSMSEEIDLLFSNVGNEDGLRRLDSELLVEAKNWARPVGAIEISWFATKLRRRHRKVGVLVAANGITGDPDQRTAAVSQIGQALQDGQEVVVLVREELEAVSSGERLARLLHEKLDHLVARQDILIADAGELRKGRGPIRFGSEEFADILRGERVKLVEEAQSLGLSAAYEGAAREGLEASLGLVAQVAEEWDSDSGEDPRGLVLRAALMDAAGRCVVWLELFGYDEARTIWFNAWRGGLDRVGPSVGSRLWSTLTDYYLAELATSKPEAPREVLLFALLGMLIEEILSLDEYWPEPEEY